jgi:diketogulonate reductase-like aldo/keto reductase
MGNASITAIATKHSKSSAQILGRWCVQQNIVYIPKSEKKERMVENAGVFDFVLDAADMETLNGAVLV